MREDLERLGQAAWMVECVARLTAERDPQSPCSACWSRGLRALDGCAPAGRVAIGFGVRCIEALGHRPRLDACVACGRAYPSRAPALGDGGLNCEACAARVGTRADFAGDDRRLRAAPRGGVGRGLALPLGRAEAELPAL